MEYLIIDSTVVRAHHSAAGAPEKTVVKYLKPSVAAEVGFTTKVHVGVDGLGNPLRFRLTGGQEHDVTQAEALISDIESEP